MEMIGQRRCLPLIQMLVLLLLLSSCLVHPLAAVPAQRSLALGNKEEPAAASEVVDQLRGREVRVMEEVITRMEIESNDYPGSGANNRHDPKSPGRA